MLDKSFSSDLNAGKLDCLRNISFRLKDITIPVLLMLFGIMISPAAKAQDKIIQKHGKEIKAKVLSSDSKYIRYKRFDNPNGPDYFLFRSDVQKIEYQNGNIDTTEKQPEVVQQPVQNKPTDLQILEQKALRYKKRSTIFTTVGAVAVIAGAATFIKLNGDYSKYKTQIQETNDAYTNWYNVNYLKAPPASDLQTQESFATFAPAIYGGAVAIVGGIALELIGLRNIKLAKKAATELANKQKELSFQPFYQPSRNTAGLTIALSF